MALLMNQFRGPPYVWSSENPKDLKGGKRGFFPPQDQPGGDVARGVHDAGDGAEELCRASRGRGTALRRLRDAGGRRQVGTT